MPSNYQSIYDTLGQIKDRLGVLQSTGQTGTPEQRNELGASLNNLGATISSDQARNAVSSARTNAGQNDVDPTAAAIQARAEAEARAKEAEARAKDAEAAASISDQRLKAGAGNTTSTTTGAPDATKSASSVLYQNLLASEPQLADYGLTEENVNDPVVVASLRYQAAREDQLKKDAQALNAYVANKEQRVRDQVALIDQSIQNQSEQLKIEQRKRMAATAMSGILSGRSLYSPEEHQGLIQEIVQEGILQLQEIQLEGFKLKNEMYDDLDDFRFEAYTKKAELLKEFDQLELQTVTAIQERLQAVAKQQREKLQFDQQQMDRAGLILAEELVGASEATIKEAAKREGIDYGLLLRAVRDATFTAQDRSLTIAGKQKALAGSSGDGRFTQAELDDIDSFAQEMIDDPDFKISSVPSALRASVLARRNELQGNADTLELLETGGASFVDWINEDKTRSKYVKSQFADKLESTILIPALSDKSGSSWLTPRGVDVRRAISSRAGQTAVEIAIEQGAKTNAEIYQALFGADGIIIEYVNEEIEARNQQEKSANKSSNKTQTSTPAVKVSTKL